MEIDLAQLREDAGAAVPALITQIGSCGSDREALVLNVRELCLQFVNIAAATLLLEGRPQPFFLNLCRAAENWRRLLLHLERQGFAPPPASWGLMLVAGATVACHGELATTIYSHTTKTWQRREEYEAEFAWAQALGALVVQVEDGDDSTAQLEFLARTARSDCWPKLAQALVRGDAEAFSEAFDAALSERTQYVEPLARGFTVRAERFAAHRYLWLEGLALLRLAQKRGFVLTQDRYRYCPPLALAPVTERYRGDWVISLTP